MVIKKRSTWRDTVVEKSPVHSNEEGNIMKFNTGSDYSVSGTSYSGKLYNTSYQRLVHAFGMPTFVYQIEDSSDKIQTEWCIRLEDGTNVTIYDWKCYPTPPYEVEEWNVGGNCGFRDVGIMMDILDEALDSYMDDNPETLAIQQ